MTYFVSKPEIQPAINWTRWYDKMTGFDTWCEKWKNYHLTKKICQTTSKNANIATVKE